MRSHRSQYNFKRILIHFFRPLIENCVYAGVPARKVREHKL